VTFKYILSYNTDNENSRWLFIIINDYSYVLMISFVSWDTITQKIQSPVLITHPILKSVGLDKAVYNDHSTNFP
jgi:hypothetical protein